MGDKRLATKSWRLNFLYKIRNKKNELITFRRNRAQEHFEKNKWFRNLILKSRQLGFTTDESVDSLDDTLFTENNDSLLIAHNLDAAKSIFDKKIELAWKNLAPEIRALYKVDANTAQSLKFEFGNGTFSSIAVDTSGRSGTYNRVHVTEFADMCKKYPQRAKDIIEGTIPAVPKDGRVDIESTSQGASGEFFDMFMEAYERGNPTMNVQYKAHFYNWTWDDDEINSTVPIKVPKEFRDYQKIHKLTDQQITYYYQKWISLNKDWNSLHKEYPTTPEEAFEAIVEGTYYGVEIGMMERDGRIGAVPHDKALKVHTVWDLGVGENLAVGFYQRAFGQLRKIDYWQGEGNDGLPEAIVVIKRKPYIYGKHFGPHDIRATDMSTGKTRFETAKSLGIIFDIVPMVDVEDGIEASTIALTHTWIDKEKCKLFIKSMKNYCREWDEKRGMYKDIPYHNWASHAADEYRYAVVAEKFMLNDDEERRITEAWNFKQQAHEPAGWNFENKKTPRQAGRGIDIDNQYPEVTG